MTRGWLALALWAATLPAQANPPLRPGAPLPEACFEAGAGTTCTSAFRGRLLVLNLWATWCLPCVRELPMLDRLQQHHGETVAVVALAVDRRGRDAVRRMRAKLGITHLQDFFDGEAQALATLGLRGIPVTLLVDARGIVRARLAGELDEPALQRHVAGLLANPIHQEETSP